MRSPRNPVRFNGTAFMQARSGMGVAGTYEIQAHAITIIWNNGFAYRGKLDDNTIAGNDGETLTKK